MDFNQFTAISFDCYGTLIDWESGILPTLRRVLTNHDRAIPDTGILELFGEFEACAETGPYQRYRDVLQSVVRDFAARFHFEASPEEIRSLEESVPTWPPFADTVPALLQLKKRYKLVIISNIDDNLFAETRKHLGMNFDAVITAEQAGTYKPSINNFQMALRTLALPPSQLLHSGQSIFHDIVPARSLGISTVWVNRKSARPGIGAVRTSAAPAAERLPDLEVPDLASLAACVVAGTGQSPVTTHP
jgi:2-haloacid dehalogenase